MPYNFPIPRSRGCQPPREDSENKCTSGCLGNEEFFVNDMILHALIGRVTANNGTTYEFETLYDPELKAMEVDIPSCYMDYLETVQVGPNIQRYLRWLIGIAFGGLASNLYWAGEDELVDLGGGVWQTPHDFFDETLAVFVNGKKVDRHRSNGFEVLSDNTFKMKDTHPSSCGAKISVGYMKNE
ncbi:MAG: hypothetical protein GF411_20580 [Candidatus Lokiarchaeota archaeon]|nr:hypothetical protein [Candidatus Lokiarchaeota archaeon]